MSEDRTARKGCKQTAEYVNTLEISFLKKFDEINESIRKIEDQCNNVNAELFRRIEALEKWLPVMCGECGCHQLKNHPEIHLDNCSKNMDCTCPDADEPHRHNIPPRPCSKCGWSGGHEVCCENLKNTTPKMDDIVECWMRYKDEVDKHTQLSVFGMSMWQAIESHVREKGFMK